MHAPRQILITRSGIIDVTVIGGNTKIGEESISVVGCRTYCIRSSRPAVIATHGFVASQNVVLAAGIQPRLYCHCITGNGSKCCDFDDCIIQIEKLCCGSPVGPDIASASTPPLLVLPVGIVEVVLTGITSTGKTVKEHQVGCSSALGIDVVSER